MIISTCLWQVKISECFTQDKGIFVQNIYNVLEYCINIFDILRLENKFFKVNMLSTNHFKLYFTILLGVNFHQTLLLLSTYKKFHKDNCSFNYLKYSVKSFLAEWGLQSYETISKKMDMSFRHVFTLLGDGAMIQALDYKKLLWKQSALFLYG